jgi:hypothetical protein
MALKSPALLVCHRCGREQALATPRSPGGLTLPEAYAAGWSSDCPGAAPGKSVRGLCPFCQMPS